MRTSGSLLSGREQTKTSRALRAGEGLAHRHHARCRGNVCRRRRQPDRADLGVVRGADYRGRHRLINTRRSGRLGCRFGPNAVLAPGFNGLRPILPARAGHSLRGHKESHRHHHRQRAPRVHGMVCCLALCRRRQFANAPPTFLVARVARCWQCFCRDALWLAPLSVCRVS